MHRRLLALSLAAALAGPLGTARADHHDEAAPAADVVVLTDGRRIEGEIVGRDERFVSIRSAGVLRAYPMAEIAQVVDRDPAAGESGAAHPSPLPAPTAGEARDADTKGKKPGTKGKKPGKAKRKARRPDAANRDATAKTDVAPLTPAAQRWLGALLDRALASESPDPAVAASIGAALKALGPAAVPQIESTARTAGGPVAERLLALAGELRASRRATATSDRAPAETADGPRRRSRPGDIVSELGLDREQSRLLKEALAGPLGEARRILKEARQAGTPRDEVRAALEPARASAMDAIRAALGDERTSEIGQERLNRLFLSLLAPRARGETGDRTGKRERKKPDAAE